MRECKACNIKVNGDKERCPLCRNDTLEINKKKSEALYPEISNIKKNNIVIKIMILLSVLISGICILVNYLVDEYLHWSAICIAGIIYAWVTILYSIKNNVNIASHVMLQTIAISILTIVIDITIGYRGWSVELALPIIISIANITIFVLYLITRRKYIKYIIYQVVVFVFSMIPLGSLIIGFTNNILPTAISTFIALMALICTVMFSSREVKDELERRFHF